MNNFLKNALKKIGVDGAIFYTVLARVIQAGGGVISIVLIARCLTKVEQGYYFTFGSILAIQIFFELGLANIITQFVAHEMAHLTWVSKTEFTGAEDTLSRLSSLLHFCIKWFVNMGVVLCVILIIAGYFFFSHYKQTSMATYQWLAPWIIIAIATACSLMVSPLTSFFEGFGQVKQIAKVTLIEQILNLVVLYSGLFLGLKLFASPLASVAVLSVRPIWVLFSYRRRLLTYLWKQLKSWQVNYRSEIFPYQWRIALSWISGYLIFQLFVPVIFATDGAVTAGQMGMSLAALSGVLSISLSWINTKVPLFSQLIAKKQYAELDTIFYKTLKQASFICAMSLILLLGVVTVLQRINNPIGFRFLAPLPLLMLCVASFVNQLVAALATYLRCHKKEPFLVQSVVLGILTAISTLVFGNLFGVNGIVFGYTFIIVVISLTWSINIFRNKKNEWHRTWF